jgi:hypothetical protein
VRNRTRIRKGERGKEGIGNSPRFLKEWKQETAIGLRKRKQETKEIEKAEAGNFSGVEAKDIGNKFRYRRQEKLGNTPRVEKSAQTGNIQAKG